MSDKYGHQHNCKHSYGDWYLPAWDPHYRYRDCKKCGFVDAEPQSK